jgi:uridine kinase
MRPFLIGVAGPSCAGKSEISNKLAAVLKAPIVSLDSYYRQLSEPSYEERAKSNFDAPDALDADLLLTHVRALAAGSAIRKPVYDFTCHNRAEDTELVVPQDFTIVEGLFALHWAHVRRLYSLRIFVSVDDATCFARRLERDIRERGRTPESVRHQYAATVRPMAEKYVLPTASFADIQLDGRQPIPRSAAIVLDHIERHEEARLALSY